MSKIGNYILEIETKMIEEENKRKYHDKPKQTNNAKPIKLSELTKNWLNNFGSPPF
jgi:hypothetical protein